MFVSLISDTAIVSRHSEGDNHCDYAGGRHRSLSFGFETISPVITPKHTLMARRSARLVPHKLLFPPAERLLHIEFSEVVRFPRLARTDRRAAASRAFPSSGGSDSLCIQLGPTMTKWYLPSRDYRRRFRYLLYESANFIYEPNAIQFCSFLHLKSIISYSIIIMYGIGDPNNIWSSHIILF